MLVVLPVVAMDLQFAAMPEIARDLGASVASVQLTLSAFAISFGILQLIYGPASDRIGRKPLRSSPAQTQRPSVMARAAGPSQGSMTLLQ